MNINTKFDDLTIVDHRLILNIGKKGVKEISFSELDKIYIKVSKIQPLYELGFILFSFLLLFLSVQFVTLETVMFIGLSIIIPVFVKINNYKSYGLIVCLKDGTCFCKKLYFRDKGENISIINSVRREQLNYYAKTNASDKLESLKFCQNMTS